jgi:hypothetical protein
MIVDKYESLNAVYQSEGHPIFMMFCGFRILHQSWRSIRQYHVENFTFSSPSLLNYNMYAVSVSEHGGFRITKARFDPVKDWGIYNEDSGVI